MKNFVYFLFFVFSFSFVACGSSANVREQQISKLLKYEQKEMLILHNGSRGWLAVETENPSEPFKTVHKSGHTESWVGYDGGGMYFLAESAKPFTAISWPQRNDGPLDKSVLTLIATDLDLEIKFVCNPYEERESLWVCRRIKD